MTTGKIVGLDVGDVRIGIAVSDEMRLIASPHSVYRRIGFGPDVKYIKALCDQLGTRSIVCGLPRNMDGSIGFQAQKVQALAEQLANAGLDIAFQDERLTTVTAERALIEGGMHRQERRGTVDKVAAAVILQQYLDTLRNQI
jgi:putative holliday junction resolvase